MNRPSPSDFMLGRRGGGVVFFCLGFYSIYAWVTQEEHHEAIPWLVPVGVILLGSYARKARQRIAAYSQWKGAWDQMAGIAPPPRQQSTDKRQRQRAFVIRAGALLWLVLSAWLMTNAQAKGTPRYMTFGLIYWLLTVWGTGAALLWAGRGMLRLGASSASSKPAREHIVSVCLPVPRTSPRSEAIAAALPDYCQQLLARQHDAPAATSGDAEHASSP